MNEVHQEISSGCASPHQAARGVVKNGADLDLDIAPPLERLLEQHHHVLALHPLAVEALGPLDQPPLGQALLLQGEGEGKAQRQHFVLDISVNNKIGQTPEKEGNINYNIFQF